MQMGDNIKLGVKEMGVGGVMGLLTGLVWLRTVCILWWSVIGKAMNTVVA